MGNFTEKWVVVASLMPLPWYLSEVNVNMKFEHLAVGQQTIE